MPQSFAHSCLDNLTIEDVQLRQSKRAVEDLSVDPASYRDLSNDEDAQRKLAFDTVLYYSEYPLAHEDNKNMVRVGFTPEIEVNPKMDI